MAKNSTPSRKIDQAVLQNDIAYIRADISDIKAALQSNYVTKDQFDPVKRIVYGVASLVMIALVGAFMTLVLRK